MEVGRLKSLQFRCHRDLHQNRGLEGHWVAEKGKKEFLWVFSLCPLFLKDENYPVLFQFLILYMQADSRQFNTLNPAF